MNKLFVLVAVLALTAVGHGEAAKENKVDDAAPTAKSPAKKSAKKAKKSVKVAPKPAGAAPVTEPVTAPAPASSAPTSAAPTTVETVQTAPAGPSGLIGEIDLRPTLSHAKDAKNEYHTENEVVLGYRFNKDMSLTAHQNFNTNLYNPAPAPATSGLGLKAMDGFLKFKANNLVGNPSGVALSYEVRGYVPTLLEKRDAGMITIVRNYVKLRHEFNQTFSVTLVDVPIVHVYSRAGNGAGATASANPLLENRVYLIGGVNITDSLSFELPIILQQIKNANFNGAANSGAWAHYLWIYPELLYSVTPNVAVGASWYNNSFINADFSNFSLKNGFENGYAQAVLRATL